MHIFWVKAKRIIREYVLSGICCYVLYLLFIAFASAQTIILPLKQKIIFSGAEAKDFAAPAFAEIRLPKQDSKSFTAFVAPEISSAKISHNEHSAASDTLILAQILHPKTGGGNPIYSDKQRFIDSKILRPNFNPPKRRQTEHPISPKSVFMPKFFDAHERLPRPDLSGLSHLRFLTASDFYPFNYLDSQGNLSGYNIDLIRALCAELQMENICRVETAPWELLPAKLQAGQADALIAGLAPTAENRLYLDFSRSYMRFPARFLARSDSAVIKDSATLRQYGGSFADFIAAKGERLNIGAIAGSAHEKILEDYFSARFVNNKKQTDGNAPRIIAYSSQADMINALKAGNIDLAFGDGMSFATLLNAQNNNPLALISDSAGLPQKNPQVAFIGGAYYASNLLGQGMRIAVMQNNAKLIAAFDYALWQLERKGKLAELYLRWFPISFY